MSLAENDIKSELSYAYLHAVAARAGFSCEVTGRHRDAAGVDAVLGVRRRLSRQSRLTDFTVDVQLKATSGEPVVNARRYSFVLAVDHYDKLRLTTISSPRLLVVLFLPEAATEWLVHSEEGLVTKRCAYWVSLYGAPGTANATSQTVYLPQENRLSVEGLQALMGRFSLGREGWVRYAV
jgi:hypothetical protein